MTTVTLVLVFMVNSYNTARIVHTFPSMSECQQEMNDRIAEFGNMVITADCG